VAVSACGILVLYSGDMTRSPLTLAALATSAIPGLEVSQVARHTAGTTGDYDSAVVADDAGRRFIIRMPNSPAAFRRLEDELKALSALSAGIRTRLPFQVPAEAGHVDVDGLSAIVYTFIPGTLLDIAAITGEGPLATSIGEALGALHELPTGFIDDYALPHEHPGQVRERTRRLVARADVTRRVPRELLDRWYAAIDDDDLWGFEPTVVHGSLDDQSILVAEGRVTGLLDWGALRIADPAMDLSWLMHAASEAGTDAVLAAYARARETGTLKTLRRRATLYAELQAARWLLHGVDADDETITKDAERMLAELAAVVTGSWRMRLTEPVFDAEQAEEPAAPGGISDPDDFMADDDEVPVRTDTAAATEPVEILAETEVDEVVVAEVIDDEPADATPAAGRDDEDEETATVVEDEGATRAQSS
jgi:macrolide phosphotransferase